MTARPWTPVDFRPQFSRVATRHRKAKTRLDCGCVIDRGEPYRYHVWKYRGEPLEQRMTCEFCARED